MSSREDKRVQPHERSQGPSLALVASEPLEEHPDVSERESPGHEEERVPGKPAPVRPRSWRRRIIVVLGVAAAAGLLAVTGVLVYQQALQKRARQRLRRVKSMMEQDTAVAYEEASQVLSSLQEQQPESAEVAVVRAEVEATKWGRFGGGRRSRDLAEALLGKAGKLDAAAESRRVVRGYLLLYDGEHERAAKLAESALVHHPRSARLGHILGLARLRLGDLDAAEATLRLAISHDKDLLPARYHLAVVQRLRGRLKEARALLEEILETSPRHLGARIELALVSLQAGGRPDPVLADKLVRESEPIPAYHASARLLEGRVALQRGRVGEAKKALRKAAMLQPADPEHVLDLVELYLRPGGDVSEAKRVAAGSLRRVREYPRAPLIMARLALALGDPVEALNRLADARLTGLSLRDRALVAALKVRAFDESHQAEAATRLCAHELEELGEAMKAAELSPREPLPDRVLYLACAAHGVRDRSVTLLTRLRRMSKGRKDLRRLLLGCIYLVKYRPTRALSHLRRVDGEMLGSVRYIEAHALQRTHQPRRGLRLLNRDVERHAGGARQLVRLARGLLLAGDERRAARQLRKIEELEPSGRALLHDMGDLWVRLRRYDEAEEISERLEDEAPTSPLGYQLQGEIHLANRRWKKAEQEFRRALELRPGYVPAIIGSAEVAFARGLTARGKIRFLRAHRLSGDDPSILRRLAVAYAKRGSANQTAKAYAAAARAFRRSGSRYRASELYSELGELLSRNEKKNRREVESLLKRAINIKPTHPLAYLRWAEYLRRRGETSLSVRWYRKAAKAGPELAAAHYGLGWMLVRLRAEPNEALAALQRFLDLVPSGPRVRRARRMAKRLRRRQKRGHHDG